MQKAFQSPRSGKFESNKEIIVDSAYSTLLCFNPLDRGNLNQMKAGTWIVETLLFKGFNPLDRGNLNQIFAVSRRADRAAFVSIP